MQVRLPTTLRLHTKSPCRWDNVSVHRTIKLLLTPTPEQRQSLIETLRQFTECFNQVCATGWKSEEKNGVKLHHATYYPLKEQLPRLVSDLHIQARMKATEALKSAFTRRKQGRKAGQPCSRSCPVRYNNHTFRVDWIKGEVNLASIAGRLKFPFTVPTYAAKYLNQPYETVMGDLMLKKGRLWLHVVLDLSEPQIETSTETVGVDLGITRPAVTSHNKFLGQKHWKELENRTFRLRRALQAKGTKSAKRHLRKLAGKQLRQRRDHDHVVSKRIVQNTPKGGTIVLENLTDIRKRAKQRKGKQNRRFHGWSFAQLAGFITYKAREQGISTVFIDPRNTSKTCSKCGHCHRSNRKTQAVFKCRQCGYELKADLNGARNICLKHRACGGKPPASAPTSTGVSSQPSG